jgi:hypothetical protein
MGQALSSWASFANQGDSFDQAKFQMIFIRIICGKSSGLPVFRNLGYNEKLKVREAISGVIP